jgi:hypothetical protein
MRATEGDVRPITGGVPKSVVRPSKMLGSGEVREERGEEEKLGGELGKGRG